MEVLKCLILHLYASIFDIVIVKTLSTAPQGFY